MLALSDAVEEWLYPAGTGAPAPRRALLLGAGFTKSCWPGAPTFDELADVLRERLREPPEAGEPASLIGKAETSELVEMLDHRRGRAAVARAVLSEPTGHHRLYPPMDPAWRPPSPRAESTFRSLLQWKEAVETTSATHLEPLKPAGAAVMLGRLVAERVVDQILTTNWDAYAELGCLLAGIRVCDGDEDHDDKPGGLRNLTLRLWVFESPRDAAQRTRSQVGTTLLKLHGGVRSLQSILIRLLRAEIAPSEAEAELRTAFLVASEDLIHWEVPSQWVADVTSDTLRSHSLLTIGVSGADPVVYRAFRSRIREWERLRPVSSRGEVLRHPALVGTDKYPKARALNMLTLADGRGHPRIRLARAGGREVLRGAYAWCLLEERLLAPMASESWAKEAGDLLRARLRTELDSLAARDGTARAPLLSVLCDSLGPGLRWAAIAERRDPFGEIALCLEPLRRWRYAPWPKEAVVDHLREIVSFLVMIVEPGARAGDGVEVDPWTGVLRLAPRHPILSEDRLQIESGAVSGAALLPLPWPWRARAGLSSPWLWQDLSERIEWGPGMPLGALAHAPLSVVLLPSLPCDRGSALVGGVRASIFRPPGDRPLADFWWQLARDWLGSRNHR